MLDTTAILLIIMPTLMPVATSFGIDPVHFGVVVVVNLGIGMVTPPVGLALFVACGLSKRSISTVIWPLLPIILAMAAVLMLITYVPFLVTFLPHLMRGN